MSSTQKSLKAVADNAYAPTSLPSYAPAGLLNRYDPALNAYNFKASNTRRIRASLGRAKAGAGAAHWMIGPGDSTSDRVSANINDPLGMWHREMRSILGNLGIPIGGDGLVKLGPTTTDPRVTLGGAWTKSVTYLRATSVGATITFVSADPCTNIDVVYFASAHGFAVAVDGGAAVTVTPPGTGLSKLKYSLTGLANTVHTVVITTTTTTSNDFAAIVPWKPNALNIHNCALYGSRVDTVWLPAGSTSQWDVMRQSLPAAPDVLFVGIGVNDINTTTNPATAAVTRAAIRDTLAKNANASDIVLIGQYQPVGTPIADWQAWMRELYGLADELDCPFVDLVDRSGGYTIANAAGLMFDGTHPGVIAQNDWGRNMALAIYGA